MYEIIVAVEQGHDGDDQSEFPIETLEIDQSKSLDEANENVRRIKAYDDFAAIHNHPHIYKDELNTPRPDCMTENGDLLLVSGGKIVVVPSCEVGFGGYYDCIISIGISLPSNLRKASQSKI